MSIALIHQAPQASDRVLLMEEVSELTRIPMDTLRFWRQAGRGPKSYRLGKRVVYDASDLQAWMDEQKTATAS